jgi:hypothetical protein
VSTCQTNWQRPLATALASAKIHHNNLMLCCERLLAYLKCALRLSHVAIKLNEIEKHSNNDDSIDFK